ncbi:type II secretion system F family protein [Candidatus Gracilibacteria bacterium]|nr:type II secretion system F family protein [Candidatus Gracilibacteria bacterium]
MLEKKSSFLEQNIFVSKNVSVLDKANFYEYISVMIDGGVSFAESLSSAHEKVESTYFKKKIQELIVYISSGDSLSKAMKKIPQIFKLSEVSIVESGEETGGLVSSLAKLSEDMKKREELRKKISGALTYPTIIFVMLAAAVTVVLTYVVPSIQPLFETADVELPAATQALIATSDFISGNFALLILILISCVVSFIGYKNTPSGRASLEKILFEIPLVGTVYKNYILANIASTLASLTGAGVNFVKTLSLVGRSSQSPLYESLFDDIRTSVSKGEGIVAAMEEVNTDGRYFPTSFLQMLSVGEKTASLEKIGHKLSSQYEREVEYSLSNVTKWIEPLALLVAGGFVLWFAFAILGAILKITQVVG